MSQFRQFLGIIFTLLLTTSFLAANGAKTKKGRNDEELRLMEYLLNYHNHNQLVRPVQKPSDRISVSFGITLVKLLEVSEGPGHITTNVLLTMEWKDSSLQWNSLEYGNISTIRIPSHRIWVPDILPYNNAADSYGPMFETKAIINANGRVTLVSPYIMVTLCTFIEKATEQSCGFKFGSWTYNELELDLVMKEAEERVASKFTPKADWEIMGFQGIKTQEINGISQMPFPVVTYTLQIKRSNNFK